MAWLAHQVDLELICVWQLLSFLFAYVGYQLFQLTKVKNHWRLGIAAAVSYGSTFPSSRLLSWPKISEPKCAGGAGAAAKTASVAI